jgi:hypothetical protein
VSLELLHDVWRHCNSHVVGTGPLDFDALRGVRESAKCTCGGEYSTFGSGRIRLGSQALDHCYACDGPRESSAVGSLSRLGRDEASGVVPQWLPVGSVVAPQEFRHTLPLLPFPGSPSIAPWGGRGHLEGTTQIQLRDCCGLTAALPEFELEEVRPQDSEHSLNRLGGTACCEARGMLDAGGVTQLRSTGFSPQFARVIVLRAGLPSPDILLVWNATGDHQLPGGYRERTESLRLCVIRKLREETGLKVHLDQLIFLRSTPWRPTSRPGLYSPSHLGHYYVVIFSDTAA